MLIQHFCSFIGEWKNVGVQDWNILYMESAFVYASGYFLTPSISQVFLALACFNLAKRSKIEFKIIYRSKMKLFGILFAFFYLENFVVEDRLTHAFSINHSILTWMMILALIATLYRWFGWMGVGFTLALSFVLPALPIDPWMNQFENLVSHSLFIDFKFEARPHYFLGSGCIGFLLGTLFHQVRPKDHAVQLSLVLLGLTLYASWVFWGVPFSINPANILETEYDQARSLIGLMGIWGTEISVISALLYLSQKKIQLNIPLINWVGMHSLLIFAFHRILFVRVLGPIRSWLEASLSWPMRNSSSEIFTFMAITLALCYLVKRTRVFELITRSEKT